MERRYLITKGNILRNSVSVFWARNVKNFGDLLNPILLKSYGLTPIYANRSSAKVLAIGSILDDQPENYSGFIVGSGLIKDITKVFPYANVLAVRGKLTRERIGAPASTILGDPGLLADRLLLRRQTKQFVIGLIPHYVDKANENIQKIYHRNKDKVLIIDVQQSPKKVISNIDKCEFILSSSLHGIIAADSLGIPNAWINLSDKVIGYGYKFYDYASSFGMEYVPKHITGDENLEVLKTMTHEPALAIQTIKNELDYVFKRLNYEILKNYRNN